MKYELTEKLMQKCFVAWLEAETHEDGVRAILAALPEPAPVVASAEERVTVVQRGAVWEVLVDGGGDTGDSEAAFMSESKAQIYRRGLIADLKEKEQGK